MREAEIARKAEKDFTRLLALPGLEITYFVPCDKCRGIGCEPCLLHGTQFVEQYRDGGNFICGKCGDEGKGEDADLGPCMQCGGSRNYGQRRNVIPLGEVDVDALPIAEQLRIGLDRAQGLRGDKS